MDPKDLDPIATHLLTPTEHFAYATDLDGDGEGREEFEDSAEAARWKQDKETQALLRATPEQKGIRPGNYYHRTFRDTLGNVVAIYGHILKMAEIAMREHAAGSTNKELSGTLSRIRKAMKRGYRLVEAFSTITPDGEIDFEHVVNMTKITEADFEAARQRAWRLPEEPSP